MADILQSTNGRVAKYTEGEIMPKTKLGKEIEQGVQDKLLLKDASIGKIIWHVIKRIEKKFGTEILALVVGVVLGVVIR